MSRKGFSQKQYKIVRKMIQSDKSYKEKQQSVVNTNLLTTGDLTEITLISEGDDFNVRASDKCYLTKIEMQLELGETEGNCRVIVARGRNGPLSTADFPTITGAVNIDKLQVYYDRLLSIQGGDLMSRRVSFKKSFSKGKIPHMVLRYDDDISAFACQHNPVYLWAVSGEGDSTGPKIFGNVTANFYDSA